MAKSNLNKSGKTANVCSVIFGAAAIVTCIIVLIATNVRLGQFIAALLGF